jgi:hypothetical protein
MDTINFTRGVPANESFPTTDLIDSAGAVFKTHGTRHAAVRALARLRAAAASGSPNGRVSPSIA